MFVVAILLVIYFWRASPAFLTRDNIVNISQITAPVAIIAIGEVFLLVCGEIDLSVGFIFAFSPFLMHYLIDSYGVPAVLAVFLSLLMGVAALRQRVHHGGAPGAVVHRHTRHRVHPLGLIADHLECLSGEHPGQGTRHRATATGTNAGPNTTWAIVLVVIFQVVLSRTRWGLHTVAVGGNILGASEAGISVAKIKYSAFMLSGFMGALVGMQEAFRTNSIDPSSGGYTPMFYAIAGAVIGGTALAGGSAPSSARSSARSCSRRCRTAST